jgi:thiol-disulfide isomerase/thioredoxin
MNACMNSSILRYSILSVFALMLFASCHNGGKPLKEGRWRGVFTVPGHEIPFIFEVSKANRELTVVYLINGAERVPLKNITYSNDSVNIPVDLFDAVLTAKLSGNSMSGKFRKLNSEKPGEGIPFHADAGADARFLTDSVVPSFSLSGTWDIEIGTGENIDKTVGLFDQKESALTGSILTNTGDYRYLEGNVGGKRFHLSAFSGNSPYLVSGEFTSDSTFLGEFVTSRHISKMAGKRNPKAALADPYSFSKLLEGHSTIDFTFPNLDNVKVSLADPKYRGKVVIVTILGSWCPNCLDETAFLAPWYKENRDRGVEIIGLAFERKNDFEFAKRTLTRLKARFDIRYELLFAGLASTESASKALPALSGIAAFPSTIFIDKKGNVRKVHTGFSGPATGRFYDEFKADFNNLVNELLKE